MRVDRTQLFIESTSDLFVEQSLIILLFMPYQIINYSVGVA